LGVSSRSRVVRPRSIFVLGSEPSTRHRTGGVRGSTRAAGFEHF
jgi:hypothetical protein